MLRFVKDEALAYLKLGLLAPGKNRIPEGHTTPADFGVLFVPGLGANASQFANLKRALAPHVKRFDAFEYSGLGDLQQTARRLMLRLARIGAECERLLVVGHSLGGLLLRMVLQEEEVPSAVCGYVSICAPLHGTKRSRVVPASALRLLAPESALVTQLVSTADRLHRWDGAILTVGARRDQFIAPHDSALLDRHDTLELTREGHAGSLFSPDVHRAVVALAERLKR